MENNNEQVISLLTEINSNLKLVLEECKKKHQPPNLLDIFGGMNNNNDDDDDDEDEDEDEDKEEDEDEEEDEEEDEDVEEVKEDTEEKK